MKHIASVALVVGLDALLGCRGLVLLGSEPQPDGSPTSIGDMMMSSGDSPTGPLLGSESQPDGGTTSITNMMMSSGDSSSGPPLGSEPQPDGSTTSDSAVVMSRADSSPAPTWTEIWFNYLQQGTPGNCNTACHLQMSSAAGAYDYLKAQGYINGTGSILAKIGSCLSWYGGNMPPGGPNSVPMAVSDMNAWAAAGAMNN